MIDNLSLKIEEDAHKLGSHILAVLEFCEQNPMYDAADMIEILHPCVVEKVKQEFIDKGFLPKLRNKNTITDFLKG